MHVQRNSLMSESLMIDRKPGIINIGRIGRAQVKVGNRKNIQNTKKLTFFAVRVVIISSPVHTTIFHTTFPVPFDFQTLS